MHYHYSKSIKTCLLAGLTLLFSSYGAANNEAKIGDLEYLDSLYKQQAFKAVIENLQQVAKSDMSSEHYRYLIYSYAELNLDDAERAAEAAITALPDEPDVFLMHASIMGSQASNSTFSSLEYAEKALNSLNKAVALAPDEIQYREAIVSFHLNAPSTAGGDKNIALQQIKIIENLDLVQGKVNLAWYYRETENMDASLQILLQAQRDFPNNISILNALASHYLSQENYENAIDSFIQLTEISLVRPFADEIGVLEAYDESRYRQLNAHYQIGRIALAGKTRVNDGIFYMRHYIATLQNPDSIGVMDVSGLPSIDWAYLRLAGLLLLNDEKQLSKEALALISLNKDDDNMAKIYAKLKKQLR